MAISGFGFSEETVQKLMRESDTNGDGVIDITELQAMVVSIKKKALEEHSQDPFTIKIQELEGYKADKAAPTHPPPTQSNLPSSLAL